MRKLPVIGIVTLVFGYLYVLPCQAQHTLEGDWTGGIDFGREWQSINLSFKREGATTKGTLDFPQQNRTGLGLKQVIFEFPHVHIEWQGRTAVAVFDGVLESRAGSCREGGSQAQ